MSKHLINKHEDWANDAIKGYLLANNKDLIALADFPKVVIRRDFLSLQETNSRVALISGGGSGHEPAHLGFLGNGMLTAAVCGDLFASPSTASILAAIRFVGAHNKAGVLLIVKNYTGDRLNFGLAAKRAQLEGINVDMVLIDDDWALAGDAESERDASVGRRGLCGTVFIHKIAGALAEQRKSLKEIKETLEHILKNHNLRTIGVSLSGRFVCYYFLQISFKN
jgi:dihydroxyacetone kinase